MFNFIYKNDEAFAKASEMRATLALDLEQYALPPGDFSLLVASGEGTRFARYLMEKIALPKEKLSPSDLRDIVVREMKSLRAKVGKDMKTVPPSLTARCNAILWDN